MISALLSPDHLEKTITSIVAELSLLGRYPISADELERAKLNVSSYFIRSRETMSGEARTAANFEALAGDYRAVDKYLSDLDKLTSDDLVKVAAKYLTPDNMTVAVMLPEATKTDFDNATVEKMVRQGRRPGSHDQGLHLEQRGPS